MKTAVKIAFAGIALVTPVNAGDHFDVEKMVKFGTPPENRQDAPSRDQYEKALKDLDMEAVKHDMKLLLADSRDFWPADWGNYGPFMVRLAWHCSGSYRGSDGVGGCGGGRQRFDPEANWPDNTNLDKARALVAPLKKKYGDALSWGDLFILAGTTGLRAAGAPITKMCFGRVDDSDGQKSQLLGPTALQAEKAPCKVDGDCQYPLGAKTLGLIYVNPEGPMGNPDLVKSVKNVRQTFEIMGHSASATVALIGGGHAIGKSHGACPAGAGKLPKDAYKAGELPWQGLCGSGNGEDTATSGIEGAWTSNPLKWSNQFFQDLLQKAWEVHRGPGGKWQWRIKSSDSKLMRMTTDLSLLYDAEYSFWVQKFAANMDEFNNVFDGAWYNLTTRHGAGTWADNAKCDDGAFPEELRHVKNPDVSNDMDLYMMNTDVSRPTQDELIV